MKAEAEPIEVLRCWHCAGTGESCHKCRNTGSLFWAGGYAFPYTPKGEKSARASLNPRNVGEGKP